MFPSTTIIIIHINSSSSSCCLVVVSCCFYFHFIWWPNSEVFMPFSLNICFAVMPHALTWLWFFSFFCIRMSVKCHVLFASIPASSSSLTNKLFPSNKIYSYLCMHAESLFSLLLSWTMKFNLILQFCFFFVIVIEMDGIVHCKIVKIKQENVPCELSTHADVHTGHRRSKNSSRTSIEIPFKESSRQVIFFVRRFQNRLIILMIMQIVYFCAALNLIPCHSYSMYFLCCK